MSNSNSTQTFQPTTQTTAATGGTSKGKRKATGSNTSETKAAHFTTRNPPWTYLKLQLIHQPGTPTTIQSQPLDALTARTYLTSAFSQFLGLAGTAISVDILKIESPLPTTTTTTTPTTAGPIATATPIPQKSIWIRVPRQDAPAVVSALSSWVGGGGGGGSNNNTGNVAWRVCAKGNFLGALVEGSGRGLFVPV